MTKAKIFQIPSIILSLITTMSGAVLGGSASAVAPTVACTVENGLTTCRNTSSVTATVTVEQACTLGSSSGSAYTLNATVTGGSITRTTDAAYTADKPSLVASCNDANGFKINAVGNSDAVTVSGVTYTNYLVGTNGLNIETAARTTGDSAWAMKVSSVSGIASGSSSTVTSAYNNTYAAVPNSETKILGVSAATSGTATATVRTDYQMYMSGVQAAGTYTGAVKYTLVPGNS